MSPWRAGVFGKLPARGDFVRFGLPDAAVSVLDAWISRNLHAQQAHWRDRFDQLWEQAPAWRFRLDRGRLDPDQAASGLWVPSIDRAGRCFPLLLLVLHPPDAGAGTMLDALQPLLADAVREDTPPEALRAAIGRQAGPAATGILPETEGWRRPALVGGGMVELDAAFPEGEAFGRLLRFEPRELDPP